MKKFIEKVQTIGNKAAQIQQAIQGAPPKIMELRQAVAASAEELHQLRTDVQANLNGLRAHTEHRLVEAMHEIHGSTDVWAQAGYELAGMDLDLALNQRLAVHLEKMEDVSHDEIKSLLAREKRETIRCILGGLLKSEETADNIDFSHLEYHGVTVHVGAAPAIRMSWRSPVSTAVAVAAPAAASPAATVPTSATTLSAAPLGSFFEPRSAAAPPPSSSAAAATTVATPESHSSGTTPVAASPPTPPEPSPWSRSALDRFKKMPDLSRHRSS